jgi:hypothetical protein
MRAETREMLDPEYLGSRYSDDLQTEDEPS